MPRLSWGVLGERYYETGVDRGVLYVDEANGVAWNGLISVTETPSGGDPRPYYLDGIKFLNCPSAEEYEAAIKAFSSPPEFDDVDGTVPIYIGLFATHQRRKSFGLTYRTKLGNDVDGVDHGYKIHLIYNALAAPSDQANSTISNSSKPVEFNWVITTTPSLGSGYKPTAHLVIDSRMIGNTLLDRIEDILYGSDVASPTLPTTEELMALFSEYVIFKITLIGVDSYIAEGSSVEIVEPGLFAMEDESVVDNADGSFTIL